MTGCFSWCIPGHDTESKTLTKIETGARPSNEDNQVTPSAAMYFRGGVKATASSLKSISSFVPVPLVSELLGVAIRVIEACDNAAAVEENVKELQQRVYSLSLVIVDAVPADSNLSKEFQDKVIKLQSILNKIFEDLNEIKRQKKWLLFLFPDINKDRVGKSLDRLNVALEEFNVSQQLHIEELLEKINSKYSIVTGQLSDVTNQLDRIEDRIEAAIKPHSSPYSLSRQDMPRSPKIFYGRDRYIADIVGLLANKDTSRVCVTGPGGMGKTGVALAVIHSPTVQDIFPNYRFWVPCIKATSPDLLRRILYTQLSITAESYDGLDALINELKATEERRLLLLDNFETPWFSADADDQAQVCDILNRLAELPHVALMVTMTSAFPPSEEIPWQQHELPALDPSAARATFVQLYPGASDAPEVDALLNAVGHMPLAIILMAADGKRSRASAKDLLMEWGTAGPGMIGGMDRRIKLSVDLVKAMDFNSEALMLLAILSLLPNGTTGDNLRWWANLTSHSAAVSLLRTAALVEQGDGSFGSSRIFLRPTIQAYMVQHSYISAEVREQVHDACYKFVLRHKSTPDDAHFKDDLQALASEETNIQGLLMQNDVNNPRPDVLVTFSLYQFRTKLSTVVAQRALTLASAAQDHRCVAEAHEVLGKVFLRLARYEEACQHFEEAHRCFKSLPTGADLPRAGECSMQLAETWMYMQTKSREKINSLVSKAQGDLSHDKDDKYNVARGLLGLGRFLWWSESLDEAHEKLTTAKDEFEKLGCSASVSECLFFLARTQASLKNYLRALDFSREALATAERSGDNFLIGQALRTNARCLIVLEFYDKAEPILKRSLSQSRALGHPLAIAQNFELLGYNYAARRNLHAALVSYRAAQARYDKIGTGSSMKEEKGKARCASNLEELARGQTTELERPMLF